MTGNGREWGPRSAFPDSFNRRLFGIRAGLEALLGRYGEHLTAAFLSLEPDEELEEGETYRCAMTLVHPTDWQDLDAREAMEDEFREWLDRCPGIDLVGIRALSEREFTLDDLRVVKRLDVDFLSHGAEEESPLLPGEIDLG